MPILSTESERFEDIYNIENIPILNWEYSKIVSKFANIKCLGVYKDYEQFAEGTINLAFDTWWKKILKYYLGESDSDHMLYKDPRTIFYIFLTSDSPTDISKVIKLDFNDNKNALPDREITSLQDENTKQALLGKCFNVAQYTNYTLLEDYTGNDLGFTQNDFPDGYILTFEKGPNNTIQPKYIKSPISVEKTTTLETIKVEDYPYLYLGEFYKDLDYSSLYGGTDDNALENINWIPSSQAYSIATTIDMSEGDTYYQRWDCLKTYPYTEEDINKVVDVTSFMVETRRNLDGSYSKRIGNVKNVLTIRPDNFNTYNDVYNQSDNFFTFNILDEKYKNAKYKNQIIWSLSKKNKEDIDSWTNITLNSSINLDGVYGKINKILNYNDSILAFQDKGISVINFNNRTALSTEGGLPIEIANSGKVNGYNMLSTTSGCTNKELSIVTSNGLYYIDVYNSVLYRFNNEGLTNISEKGMSVWFKNNIKDIKRLMYDFVTQDLYIVTTADALIFNEKLQTFTTFVDHINEYNTTLFNVKEGSFTLNCYSNTSLEKMHAGEYISRYKMVYRVNPDPLMDKVFTNIEYLSELYDGTGANVNKSPFESLEVENDYQYGKTLISNTKYPMNRRKFRIWRMDLPRDARSKWGLDRIRSPWITLTLNGKNNGERLEFHNLNVIYYK